MMRIEGSPEPSLPMSVERLLWCLDVLGWTLPELARQLHVNPRGVRRYQEGTRPIPDNVAVWLEKLTACHLSTGLPDGWHARVDEAPSISLL